MLNPIKWFARRREIKRLDRMYPNPRSSTPRGALEPLERHDYAGSVLRTVLFRLLLLAALVAFGIWLAGETGFLAE